MSKKDNWITTFTGKKFHLFDPQLDEICIEDIAHALSLICRFGGHLPEHYSVAQHSILVSQLVSKDLILEGLLHDAEEAYIGDMVRPLKLEMPEFNVVTRNIQSKISQKFSLFYMPPELLNWSGLNIKEADNKALFLEKRELFLNAKEQVWDLAFLDAQESKTILSNISVAYMHPKIAETQFLSVFHSEWKKRHGTNYR
jgi:hypothetical protein